MEVGEESHHKREGESPVPPSLSVWFLLLLSASLFLWLWRLLSPPPLSLVWWSLSLVVALLSLHYKNERTTPQSGEEGAEPVGVCLKRTPLVVWHGECCDACVPSGVTSSSRYAWLLASAAHHSHMRVANMATQTDFVHAATFAATSAQSPVIEYVAPAPVMEYIAPAPAVTYDAPSQQLPPTYTTTTVTTDVNLDITSMVNPQFSSTVVDAPQVVGSLPLLEEFTAPVYNQVRSLQGRRPSTLWKFQLCKNR